MKRFSCPMCSARVFFNDSKCMNCGARLIYDLATDSFDVPPGVSWSDQPCIHAEAWECNWLREAPGQQCPACALDLQVASPGADLTVFQAAKRRVVRQLHRFGIDLCSGPVPMRFNLLRSGPDNPVITGHDTGLITLDIAEGNPAQLARTQTGLAEAYRAPVGHVRHEAGHWHWQARIAPDAEVLDRFRELFGDERLDYAMALERHYQGADNGWWRPIYLSHYATAHPWEDYAESFAHVLHMYAMLETAQSEGFIAGPEGSMSFPETYARLAPLTVGLNEMARSMGTAEPYPFAPPLQAVRKMAFVDDLLMASVRATDALDARAQGD